MAVKDSEAKTTDKRKLTEEVDFVRGRTSTKKPKTRDNPDSDNLFKVPLEDSAAKKKSLKDELDLGKPLELVSYKKLHPGTLLMGVVSEVGEADIVVNLPFGITGFLKGTELSEEFNSILASEDESEDTGVPDLCDIVSVGQYLLCSVLSVDTVNKVKKCFVTSKPSTVNQHVKLTGLNKHLVLQGVVQSVEDHGYLVNVGIPGTTSFLAKSPNTQLKPCDIILTTVKSVSGNSIILDWYSNKERVLSDKVVGTFSSLLPGHLVNVTVKKHTANGLRCSFLHGMQGGMHLVHLGDLCGNERTIREVFPVKRKLPARVIFLNPDNKTVLLSSLPCHVGLEGVTVGSLSKGQTLEEVEVTRVTKEGVYVALDTGVHGFAHKKKLQDKDTEKIGAKHRAGTTHKVRVMGFRLADNLVQVSLRESDLSKPFLSYADITVTSTVVGSILSIEDFGLIVKLADNIRGLVPKLHLADIRIKNPALKFKENQKVKTKVISVDVAKRRVTLTLKKSLLRNATANVTGYGGVEKGGQVTGWVAALKPFGIIMNFTGNVRGLVHASQISNVPLTIEQIEKMYKIGQVLTCRVVSVDPAAEKMSLSLNLIEETATLNPGDETKWARKGRIYPATVISTSTTSVSVQLSTGEQADLPVGHLTDFPALEQSLLLQLAPGTPLPRGVLVLAKRQKRITATAKPSLLSWISQHPEKAKITDFQVGDFLPGYVKDFQTYGCFVETASSLIGLCPKACLSDDFVSNPSEIFRQDESVVCRLTNIDLEKGRFLVSLKASDVAGAELGGGAALLGELLAEWNFFSREQAHPTGSVVQCEITRVTKEGSSVSLAGGAGVGFIPGLQEEHVGGEVAGVVLDYDPARNTYTLSAALVERVEGAGKRRRMEKGEEVTGEVVLVTENYFVVMVPDKGCRFCLAPRKAHRNDLGKTHGGVKCGEERQFTVHTAKKGKPVIVEFVGVSGEKKKRQRKKSEGDLAFDEIKLGTVYSVTVNSVRGIQLNVQLSKKVKGRVHITEVTDSPTPNVNPLHQYKQGDVLQARLIGFRHSKTHRYLPVTATDFVLSVGEFSVRQAAEGAGKLWEIGEKEKVDESRDLAKTLVVGQQITGYVRACDHKGFLWISLTPGVDGRLVQNLTATTKEDIEGWVDRFVIGQPVSCTVFSTQDDRIELSLVGSCEEGAKLWCRVKTTLPGIGVKVQVTPRDYAIIPLTEISDTYHKDPLTGFEEDALVQCCVVKKEERQFIMSTRKSRLSQRWKKAGGAGSRKATNPVISTPDDLEVGRIVFGYVRSTNPSLGVYVSLGHSVTGRVMLKNMSDQFLKHWQPMFPAGKLVRAVVVETEPKIELSMKASDLKKARSKATEEEEEEEEGDVQKCLDDILMERLANSESEQSEMSGDDEEEEEDGPNITFSQPEPKLTTDQKGLSLGDALVDTQEDQEESEEEEKEEKKEEEAKPVSKSAAKREAKRRKIAEEERLREVERASASSAETEADFEKMVAGTPDSSGSWVSFMAYWLGRGNVEKARLTAKRALDTINYRLESEKLNVWSALFNLENSFGTPDSLMASCQAAAAVNDPKAVFVRLAAVLDKSQKYEELDEIYSSVLLKKHRRSRKVWCGYATSLASQSKMDAARDLLTKALKSLPKHKHVRTISHFAQLEYRHGDPAKGGTMFENVLTSYPGRLDLWSVYIDKTIALADTEQTRLLLDRVVGLKLPAKKMKFFFKRYVDFELSQGEEERAERVRELARNYIETSDQ